MRVLIDACVLYPTVLREIVMGVADTGAFQPLWSQRILREWTHAAARLGPEQQAIAEGEAALMKARWPNALVDPGADAETGLSLPDPDDIHVLAAAIAGAADELLTLNIKDFPTPVLASHGLTRRQPDEFLLEAWHADQTAVGAVVARVHQQASTLSGSDLPLRGLLKRARLPRLGKALAG